MFIHDLRKMFITLVWNVKYDMTVYTMHMYMYIISKSQYSAGYLEWWLDST